MQWLPRHALLRGGYGNWKASSFLHWQHSPKKLVLTGFFGWVRMHQSLVQAAQKELFCGLPQFAMLWEECPCHPELGWGGSTLWHIHFHPPYIHLNRGLLWSLKPMDAQSFASKALPMGDTMPAREASQFALMHAQRAKEAQPALARCTTAQKNTALSYIAKSLLANNKAILEANARDVLAGKQAGLGAKIDRLILTQARLEAIAADLHTVMGLHDPIGHVLEQRAQPNGLTVTRVRVPLGLVGIIYESRPNVTVDASALCLKAGNAVVLKGGKEALHSNRAIVNAIWQGLEQSDLPKDAVQLLDSASRAVTKAFLGLRGVLDVVIPRGGLGLIRFAQENASVPVIETGASVVHAYVDEHLEAEKVAPLVVNAKARRPSICGALDVLLVHQHAWSRLARPLMQALETCEQSIELRLDTQAMEALNPHASQPDHLHALQPSTDYDTEFLDYVLSVSTVASLDEALAHIHQHSLKHTEAIYTTHAQNAQRFLNEVDAACVMHNTSTQFTDGAQFGLGAEIGISTQKLHVRGPFALEGLTSTKWMVQGDWLCRP